MRFTCTHCGLESNDGNLWCQRLECDFRNLTDVLRRGEMFGEFEITNVLRVMRTAAVYEAQRDEEPLILKIAHMDKQEHIQPPAGYGEYLRQESLTLQKILKANPNAPFVPRFATTSLYEPNARTPYGKLVHRDSYRYFMVFEHIEGLFLRDYLRNNPEPPHYEVAWLIFDLAKALASWHKQDMAHWALNPDTIFVHRNDEGHLEPVLMDFGIYNLLRENDTFQKMLEGQQFATWHKRLIQYLHPAYIPPELLQTSIGKPGRKTDIFGLGTIMYEMLAGEPLRPYRDRTDEQVLAEAQNIRYTPPLNRKFDLGRKRPQQLAAYEPADIIDVVQMVIQPSPQMRPYSSLDEFQKAIQSFYRHRLKKRRNWRQKLSHWGKKYSREIVAGSVALGALLLAAIGIIANL